jgi:hypothetical protein
MLRPYKEQQLLTYLLRVVISEIRELRLVQSGGGQLQLEEGQVRWSWDRANGFVRVVGHIHPRLTDHRFVKGLLANERRRRKVVVRRQTLETREAVPSHRGSIFAELDLVRKHLAADGLEVRMVQFQLKNR